VGPTVLAFFTGGYFDGPRAWAGLIAWLLVVVAVALEPSRVPVRPGVILAMGGLAALAVLSLLSMLWAPLVSSAFHAGQIDVLYLGTLLATALLIGPGERLRLVEPALVAGVTLVIGYGLSERLLPGLLHFSRSVSAQGRLEQPLTYWNAMGELAALGLVLATRLIGDRTRGTGWRVLGAVSAALLGIGLYISFSRGALFAAAAGLLSLVVMAPTREQLSGVGLGLLTAVLAAVATAPFAGVTSLRGSLSTRELQGAIVLVLLVAIALAAALASGLLARRVPPGRLRLPRRAPVLAALLVCAGLVLAIAVGAKESSTGVQSLSGGSSRLITLQSNRYDYWAVALRAFATEPVHGVGAGNWAVYWLRWRKITEAARDAHSLPLQVLAELGVLGAIALAAFLVGLALVARDALRLGGWAAGLAAGLVAYVAHAPLDWDWQMPAVTLVVMILGGSLIAGSGVVGRKRAEEPGAAVASGARQTASGA
jgi:O-antigen ligase